MSEASDSFELQIKRIHDLIEQDDSVVTWNDRIQDPDNPIQGRQIDITIKRDDSLTMIECRLHKKRQDVKWIEELIGRKISLQANTLIAVSASGFTKWAVLKANKYGIILRDILSLTMQEIESWGKKTKVSVTFFEYSDAKLVFCFDKKHQDDISIHDIENKIISNGDEFHGIFTKLGKAIEEKNLSLEACLLNTKLSSNSLKVNGHSVGSILFSANFSSHINKYDISSVVAYDIPEEGALTRNAYVEQVELGNFEIMQSTDVVSVALDLGALSVPDNNHFRRVNFEFTRPVEMESVYMLGLPDLGVSLSNFEIGLIFE